MNCVALRKFKNDLRASVVVVFGVALVPAVAFVGSAIDYARSLQERAKLQSAADATAMTMARALSPKRTPAVPVATTLQNLTDGPQSIYTLSQSASGVGAAESDPMSSADLQESAKRHFRAVHHASGGVSEPSVSAVNASSAVTINASATYSTSMMKIFGVSNVNLAVVSRVAYPSSTKFEIAVAMDASKFAVDNGSLSPARTAVYQFLSEVSASYPSAGQVKASIIPFAETVQIRTGQSGVSNNYGPAMSWLSYAPARTPGAYSQFDPQHWKAYSTIDRVIRGQDSSRIASGFQGPFYSFDCVADRATGFDVNLMTGEGFPVVGCMPKQNVAAGDPILEPYDTGDIIRFDSPTVWPLTDQSTLFGYKLRQSIQWDKPRYGGRNNPIGLMWALATLQPSPSPFDPANFYGGNGIWAQAAAYDDPSVTKTVILVTSGGNTFNYRQDSVAVMDDRMLATCNEIKKPEKKIQVFVVSVLSSSDDNALLQQCASSPAHFSNVQNVNALSGIFNSIKAKLTNGANQTQALRFTR